jgi:hypothetical protein
MRKPFAVVAGLLLGSSLMPAGPVLAVSPIDAVPVNILPVLINVSGGDQYDPHVSGDLVSYTSDTTVRVYDFYSGADEDVPVAPDSKDELSDVSNGRVTFARLDLDTFEQRVMVYDTQTAITTEIDPQPDPHRASAAIGSDAVAFIDFDDTVGYELFAGSVSGSAAAITNDTRIDQRPQVGPLGTSIVFESCASSPSNCDIHQATWNGSSWTIASLTANVDPEANPDTDGTVVVYDAVRAGTRDVCWQPLGGGSEQCLDLAGDQRNPSISEGLVAFESVAFGESAGELYVYQLSSNRLFRITSTVEDETLNDISVLGDGRVRVVWTSGEAPDRDVYGATFELPPVGPVYHFGGFTSPVDALPTLNQMKAGAAVPVKFSLGGSFGMSIFASGYPRSQTVACASTAPVDGIEQTVTAGASGLQYDAATGVYSYVWKTDKAWAGTCRQLVLLFADGSTARANFKFK